MEERADERTFKEICRELLERGTTTSELARHGKLCAEYRYYITLIREDLKKEGGTHYIPAIRLAPKILPGGRKVYNNYGYKIVPKEAQTELALKGGGSNGG